MFRGKLLDIKETEVDVDRRNLFLLEKELELLKKFETKEIICPLIIVRNCKPEISNDQIAKNQTTTTTSANNNNNTNNDNNDSSSDMSKKSKDKNAD